MGFGPMEWAVAVFCAAIVSAPIALGLWTVRCVRRAAAERQEILKRLARLEAAFDSSTPTAAP